MFVFPTIKNPSYGFTEDFQENVIASKSDGGYKNTRPRNTRTPGIWVCPYKALSDTDYQILMDFYRNKTYSGAEMFQWVHPKFKTTHVVRFSEKPPFTITEYGWDGQYTVEEV
jgi:hypothetical protein